MTVEQNRTRIDRIEAKVLACETTIRAVGGLVGKSHCESTERRIMDAIQELKEQTKDLRRSRLQGLATLVGVLVSVILSLLMLYLREHG